MMQRTEKNIYPAHVFRGKCERQITPWGAKRVKSTEGAGQEELKRPWQGLQPSLLVDTEAGQDRS